MKERSVVSVGGHRRVHRDEIQRIVDGKKRRYRKRKRGVAMYGRVSAYDQKKNGDLDRQINVIKDYCMSNNL